MLIAWISFVRLCVDINQKVAFLKRNEPPHDKTNNMACAPSEDSDQPWWMPRLICLRWAHSDFVVFFVVVFFMRRLIRGGHSPYKGIRGCAAGMGYVFTFSGIY